MTRPPFLRFLLVLALSLAAGPWDAHAQQVIQERESAWAAWHQAQDRIWVLWRTQGLQAHMQQGVEQDLERFPAALVAAGVLPAGDDHAWTEGCADFGQALAQATHDIVSPIGVEGWAHWRAVHRVMCGPLDNERALIQATFDRMVPQWLGPSPTLSWASLVLDELEEEQWECMASQVPNALRQGLDRHEGLKWVARQCRLEPSWVFGDAQRCTLCTSHPRQPRSPVSETWALR